MRLSFLVTCCVMFCFLQPEQVRAGGIDLVLAETTDFSTDNWYPLPEPEIERAVADSALSVLTQGAYLRIAQDANAKNNGSIAFSISLIGPAKIAKATINIDSAHTGSLVSTASVSLAGMDHQGIFRAFEHIGSEAASRMIAQVASRLDQERAVSDAANPELRKLFEHAMALKRQAAFPAAKDVFLRIAQYEGRHSGNWPELAADEVRYGLPMYRARYLLTGGGRFTVDPDATLSNLDVAENLLRQVYAENAGSMPRVQEAQAMLDYIQIGRHSMQRVMQASWISQITPLKYVLAEAVSMEGTCPDSAQLDEMTPHMPENVDIDRVAGNDEIRTYHLLDPERGFTAVRECNTGNYPQPIQLRTE